MTTSRANYLYPAIGMGLILSAIIFVVVLVPRWTFTPPKPKDLRDYTAQELRGREIYKREGCWYCHSQVSRPQDWDHGPKSKATDYYYDSYHLVGSERSGPDLANIGGKFPDEYHILHHKNPRYVKPGSNMPRFDYLNDQELKDLTAYLQGLGPKGTRALDPVEGLAEFEKTGGMNGYRGADGQMHYGETKYAKLIPYTWPDGPLKGKTEVVAVSKFTVEQREALNEAEYKAHWEVPYKYSAELEELMYGSSHESTAVAGVLAALTKKSFPNMEKLEEARAENPDVKGWAEQSFKEIDESNATQGEKDVMKVKRRLAQYGRGMFNNECAACHGLEANGKGQAAASMTTRPANFWEDKYADYTTDTWYWRVSRGKPATQMPRWEFTLTPEQRLNLTCFLKYVSQNHGLGKLKGEESNYGQKPSEAATALPAVPPAK